MPRNSISSVVTFYQNLKQNISSFQPMEKQPLNKSLNTNLTKIPKILDNHRNIYKLTRQKQSLMLDQSIRSWNPWWAQKIPQAHLQACFQRYKMLYKAIVTYKYIQKKNYYHGHNYPDKRRNKININTDETV